MEEKIYSRSVNKSGLAERVVDLKFPERYFSAGELNELQTVDEWAMCDKCERWRMQFEIPVELPDKWYCWMNKDPLNNSCDAEEKDAAWYSRNRSKILSLMSASSQGTASSESSSTVQEKGGTSKSNACETEKDLSENEKKELIKKDEVLLRLGMMGHFQQSKKSSRNQRGIEKRPVDFVSKIMFYDQMMADSTEDIEIEASHEDEEKKKQQANASEASLQGGEPSETATAVSSSQSITVPKKKRDQTPKTVSRSITVPKKQPPSRTPKTSSRSDDTRNEESKSSHVQSPQRLRRRLNWTPPEHVAKSRWTNWREPDNDSQTKDQKEKGRQSAGGARASFHNRPTRSSPSRRATSPRLRPASLTIVKGTRKRRRASNDTLDDDLSDSIRSDDSDGGRDPVLSIEEAVANAVSSTSQRIATVAKTSRSGRVKPKEKNDTDKKKEQTKEGGEKMDSLQKEETAKDDKRKKKKKRKRKKRSRRKKLPHRGSTNDDDDSSIKSSSQDTGNHQTRKESKNDVVPPYHNDQSEANGGLKGTEDSPICLDSESEPDE